MNRLPFVPKPLVPLRDIEFTGTLLPCNPNVIHGTLSIVERVPVDCDTDVEIVRDIGPATLDMTEFVMAMGRRHEDH